MACAAFTKLFPSSGSEDYETFIREQASLNGPMCSIASYQTNCKALCQDISKNQSACFSCLSTATSCRSASDPTKPCCQYISQANECNNCLNRYSTDALNQCLNGGLSQGAIIGIAVGVTVAVLLIVGIGFFIWYTRSKERLKQYLIHNKGWTESDLDKLSLWDLRKLENK